MHLLHRHIFFSVLTTCMVAAILFVFVLISGIALRDLLGFALSGQVSYGTLLKLIMLSVPIMGGHALYISILTGILLVLGRMSSNSEITAMRAAGLSMSYIVRPIWIVAIIGALVVLGLNFYYTPLAQTAYRATMLKAVRTNPLRLLVPRTFVRDFPGTVVYVGAKNGTEIEDFWFWELDGAKRVTRLVHAQSGRVDFHEEDNKLVLLLNHVTVENRNEKDPENFTTPAPIATLDSLPVDLKLDNLLGQTSRLHKLKWLTFGELLKLRTQLKVQADSAKELMRVNILLNDRAAGALGVLAFAILAVPLGIRVSRKETTANFGLALILLFTYYFFSKGVIGVLEDSPALRPDLLVWIPPLAFAGFGIYLFRKVGRT